ncbi:phenoloxidase-activating factor 3 [Bicyclus anynana]|uniref:CLIP domain-containing serine protease n=1 Tax=Bicyclus anynana TaxID=110368 RepID=A0A6J1MLC3_BICAN|nr:phenoloxidase-activating factor 3 [Bicyclus anynana]
MATLKFLLFIFVLTSSGNLFTSAHTRSCFDCVPISSCETALNIARRLRDGTLSNESRQVYSKSICGIHNGMPKVCCSDYSAIPMEVRTTLLRAADSIENEPTSADAIENHRNVGLLPTSCGDSDVARIVNGKEAKLYELPWMVLIAYNTRAGTDFRCGGSIINSRYILTAAHCVIANGMYTKIAYARIGELDYNNEADCQGYGNNVICETNIQDIRVEKIIPHENYNEHEATADIALLRLNETITMYKNAAPICLPLYADLRDINLDGYNGTVAGWGITEKHSYSSKLMKVQIPIKTGANCNSYFNQYTQKVHIEKTLCAGAIDKDSCDGDSGGPLMVLSDFNGSLRLVQYGIVSFGPRTCGSEYPGVYTDVSKYMDWILDNIKE